MVLYPNKLPESERVCSGICNKEDLKVAKFVDGSKNNIWHGYPANILANKQDIPPTSILLLWEKLNYINKSDIRKINQQMPCNLQK